jgi:Protein phosphatase 2C
MSVEQAARDASRDWQVSTAVVRGAAHELTGLPLQDAAGYREISGGLALAVADGHGNQRHFRSARGSELAVEAGLGAAAELAATLAASQQAADLIAVTRAKLIPALLHRWQRAVQEDLAERPLEVGELRLVQREDQVTVPYGSTLLLAVLTSRWLLLGQIGDGDIVVVGPDGTATAPVPGDPLLDGQRTTSLCQADAADSFRLAAANLGSGPVAAVLLATDGFGNAQTAEPWYPLFGADLLRLSQQHGPDWIRAQLPAWVARCASAEGSGDDAAAALMIAGPPGWSPS